MPPSVLSVGFFFCMIGFKLKVQLFSQGELFEIVMMWGICHLVIDLDDVHQYSREGERERERKAETKRNKDVLHVPTVHNFSLNVCVSASHAVCVWCANTHCW